MMKDAMARSIVMEVTREENKLNRQAQRLYKTHNFNNMSCPKNQKIANLKKEFREITGQHYEIGSKKYKRK